MGFAAKGVGLPLMLVDWSPHLLKGRSTVFAAAMLLPFDSNRIIANMPIFW